VVAVPWMNAYEDPAAKPENVRRRFGPSAYFRPPPEATAELTRLLAPGGSNR
jgi:hypothetical protein